MSLLDSRNRGLIALILLTLAVRGGVLLLQEDRLDDDVDAYLGIAKQMADGAGFCVPGSNQPTAFRPPLYPLMLAFVQSAAGRIGIILLHLALGVGTVFLVWRLGRRLLSDSAARFAACLIAFDPLLLQYSTQPMTETLCAFLSAWALNLMVPFPESRWRQLGLGLVLGVCTLGRPTFLVFGFVLVVGWLYQFWRTAKPLRGAGLVLLGMLLGIAPWGIRNAMVFREFCITTTHGGYTLLLGNNPVFYEEVIKASWGTDWDGESLNRWQGSLETEIRDTAPDVQTEFERDRWMSRRAMFHIKENSGLFLRSCGHRFLWFWNAFPPQSALDRAKSFWKRLCERLGLPRLASAANFVARKAYGVVALFYLVLFGSFIWGLARLQRDEWRTWWPLALLIASFCAVHLVYWTDARMRAPVMPAVVLLAARAWFTPSTPKKEPS